MNFGSSYVYSCSESDNTGVGGSDLERGLHLTYVRHLRLYDHGASGNECDSGDELWKPVGASPVLVSRKATEDSDSSDGDFPKAEVKLKPPRHRRPSIEIPKSDSKESEKGVTGALRRFFSSILPGEKKKAESTDEVKKAEPREETEKGKLKAASNYAWPRSRILDQIDGMVPLSELSKVLVLYCKDSTMHLLRQPYQRTPQQLCDEVQLLADILSSCGGIYCHFDGYDTVCVDNWSLWVQKTIEECDFVITICTPMLYQVVRDAHHTLVDMLRGKFYPDTVVNYISPHKFIPVFLDMPARNEWVPINLQTSTYYELYVNDFAYAMGNTEAMHPLAFEAKMSKLLEDPRFEKIASLIATVRKESVNPRPFPPPRLIRPALFGRPMFKAVKRPGDENPNLVLDEERDKVKPQAREVRRASTNIIAVNFSTLKESCEMHTGDCVFCMNADCGAALSHLSLPKEELHRDEKVWLCEFCGMENVVDIAFEEVPKSENTLYLITPPPAASTDVGDSLVIFCVDVSGSMGVTTEVPGKYVLRNHDHVHATDLQSLNATGESQLLHHERKDITYVSRLQGVQAAVENQIADLAIKNPAQRVAVVTFSDEVNIYCDQSTNVTTIAGDNLWNPDALDRIARDVPLPPCIEHTKDALCDKVLSLKEGGQTALGPALLVAVLIASRVPVSRVIICTDGLANNGVGSLEGLSTRAAYSAAQTFYSDLGLLALERGVKVSLITIKGTDCKVIELGQVADKTEGQVHTVDPLTVTQEFKNIMANPTIATNVDVKIVLHAKLFVWTRDSRKNENIIKAHIANLASDTELTYEYGVRTRSKAQENVCEKTSPNVMPLQGEDHSETVKSKLQSDSLDVPLLTINGRLYYPFQTQIEFTRRDGARVLKVITRAKPKTSDRRISEKDIDVNIVGTHAAHTVATLAIEGEYSQARVNAFAIKKLLKRSTANDQQKIEDYTSAISRIIPLENCLRDKQKEERSKTEHHCTYTGCYNSGASGDEIPTLETAEEAATNVKKLMRHKEADDEMATLAYQLKKQSTV